ncbi:uncharacterized protein C7orf57 homolog isoform X2 [Oryzias melastigma]|uniref:uncharacterized protein C7orf57 homolog isoform X2 n=1 Tax=Oryzias melastigma TaxID=30732 RepID=UPI000CF7DD01|nr:uncharacterized protein C7orf57 homolog isoform X2 [Oryzias melastigma]
MSTAVPNHRRTKPGGIKPGAANSGVTGPTSQIPGLCQSATDSAPAERVSGRRVGIFESDSDYVKLAKQGGHKGLLSHDGDDDDKPKKAYNPPNWFGDDESKRSYDKKTPPVSMSKLLSHGYMENKKKSSNDDDTSSVTSEHTSTTMTEDVDDLE